MEIDVDLEIDRFYSTLDWNEDLDGIYCTGYGVNRSAISTADHHSLDDVNGSCNTEQISHVRRRR